MTELDRELAAYLEEGGKTYAMIRHPYVYAVPFFETEEEVQRLNAALKSKRAAIETALGEKDYNRFVFLHERPYRVHAFQEIALELSDVAYWPMLREIWSDSENVFQNHMLWWEMLTSPRKKRNLFTACEDRSAFKKQPSTLAIYRGTTDLEMNGHYLGFSWTLSEDKARWFASRFNKENENPIVARAKVAKKDVIGFVKGRGEEEIVVEPRWLEGLVWEEI